jgi:hypothetical protein
MIWIGRASRGEMSRSQHCGSSLRRSATGWNEDSNGGQSLEMPRHFARIVIHSADLFASTFQHRELDILLFRDHIPSAVHAVHGQSHGSKYRRNSRRIMESVAIAKHQISRDQDCAQCTPLERLVKSDEEWMSMSRLSHKWWLHEWAGAWFVSANHAWLLSWRTWLLLLLLAFKQSQ